MSNNFLKFESRRNCEYNWHGSCCFQWIIWAGKPSFFMWKLQVLFYIYMLCTKERICYTQAHVFLYRSTLILLLHNSRNYPKVNFVDQYKLFNRPSSIRQLLICTMDYSTAVKHELLHPHQDVCQVLCVL